MSWDVRVPKRVSKYIDHFPQKDWERIVKTLREFEVDPWQGDVIKVKGEENLWRRRTGNYRIFYSVISPDNVVEIKEIKRRTSVTY